MKKIFIGVPFMKHSGVEVALVNLLKELSKDKELEIDLYVLKETQIFRTEIPNSININVIEYENEIYNYNLRFRDVFKIESLTLKIKFLLHHLKLLIYDKLKRYDLFFLEKMKYSKEINKDYDIAIDFHGYSTFFSYYVALKVHAKKKVMWVHDENNNWIKYMNNYFQYYDRFFCVGESVKNNVINNYPLLKNKTSVFYNLIDYKRIREKAKENLSLKKSDTTIITIGRLEYQKGYDILIETARILKNRDINYIWYILGNGSLKKQIERKIKKYKLNNNVIILDTVDNPYPYIKMADLYVLTSRHEGYCLATLEAKILCKAIIISNINSNKEQIKNNINGYLCDLNPTDFANKIIYLINNQKKKKEFIDKLSKEEYDYTKEVSKIYDLLKEIK